METSSFWMEFPNTAAVHNEVSVVPMADSVQEFRVETNGLKQNTDRRRAVRSVSSPNPEAMSFTARSTNSSATMHSMRAMPFRHSATLVPGA